MRDVWRRQPGDYFCIAVKEEDGFRHRFFERSEFRQVEEFIRDQRGCVYWSPNGYSRPRRKNLYALRGKFLYADLDEVDPRDLSLEPTIAWASSPGRYQALWECDGVTTDELNAALVYAVGADRDSWALNKVLRLPGTVNHKYPSRPRVKLLWDDGPTYEVRDLERRLPKRHSLPSRHQPIPPWPAPPVSDHDWRALARQYAVNVYMGRHFGDRSKTIFALVRRMSDKGASRGEIEFMVRACPAFKSKCEEQGARWGEDEIERICAKLRRH